MKPIILGTAGHIDHGKTSLIKAATGVNTDRLKEEKERGITIELGFASIDLPSGQRVSIVDVPGHEKFVKHMVAGAAGIDIVAMVIAADEGVMPQTQEHLEICALLGVKHAFIVLTKIDMVDEEWLELVLDDINSFIKGAFLEGCDIVTTSSTTGQGIPEFIQTLDQMCAQIPARPPSAFFRLPVDRVFSMHGFGTVITGSLISGDVRVGDPVMLYPSLIRSKVRGIQVHNQSVNTAESGMRTAINLQGLEKTIIQRGDILGYPDDLKPSYMLDVSLHYLSSNAKPLKNRTRIRFHGCTSEILGVLILLESEDLAPGEHTVAQIRLEAPIALVKDDHFVLRSYSPVRTIGGGQVLNPIPVKHKRFQADLIKNLKDFSQLSPDEIIDRHVNQSGFQGVSMRDIKIMTNLPDKQLQKTLQDLLSRRVLVQLDKENKIYIHNDNLELLKTRTTENLTAYHRANPLKKGMSKEELKSKLPSYLQAKLFNLVLSQLIKSGTVAHEKDTVRMAIHEVSLGMDQTALRQKILKQYQESGLAPPYFKALCQTLEVEVAQAKDVLLLLVHEGELVKIKEELYYDVKALNDLKKRLIDFLETNGEISTPQFKEMTGVSRKFVIPLIEYFDAQNLTLRVGDIRKLRTA